jgi:hypothetical protein
MKSRFGAGFGDFGSRRSHVALPQHRTVVMLMHVDRHRVYVHAGVDPEFHSIVPSIMKRTPAISAPSFDHLIGERE